MKESGEDLPDLKAVDVVEATIKIQSAYKGFKARKMIKQHKEIMPDLNCAQVQDATLKIQSAYRGFKTRKDMKEAGEELPDLKAADVVEATIKIQSAYKGFKTRQMIKKHQEILPDLNCAQVQDATVKIQSAYRGFKTRQELRTKEDSVSDSSDSSEPESQQRGKDSSDSSATESEDDSKKPTRVNSVKRAQAIKNQKGTMRRRVPDSSATESDAIESMPDTDADDEENMYTPKPRREVPDSSATESEVGEGEDMPDLDDSDVENATIKIQSAFRGFQARKNVTKPKPVVNKPKFEDIVHAAITIQRAYRRYKKNKQERRNSAKIAQQKKLALKSQKPKQDIIRKSSKSDVQKKTKRRNLAEVAMAAVTIQRAYRRYKTKKDEKRKVLSKSTQQKKSGLKLQRSQQELTRRPIKTTQAAGKKQRPKLVDVVNATTTIQRAYRRYKERKEERIRQAKRHQQTQSKLKSQKSKQELSKKTTKTSQVPVKRQKSTPKFSDVVHAAVTIQRTYRSYKKRKQERQHKKLDQRSKKTSSRVATKKQHLKRQQTFSDVVLATRTIQKAYRSYSARKRARQNAKVNTEVMPDLNCAQVQDATVKIQSAYRGFKTRRQVKEREEDLPDLAAADVVAATIKIQSAYKGFQTRKMIQKHKEIMPDLNCAQVQDATIKIQSAYRGFKTRKVMKDKDEELPDLAAADVVAATIKIQSAYKGFQTRKMIKQHKEIMPNLNCAQVQDATIKIQSAYRGFKTRKMVKEQSQDMPDLDAADVVAATIKIQSAYKGFQTRKMIKAHKEIMPDLNCAQVQDATVKIQSAYRGFKARKEIRISNEDLPNLKDDDVRDATVKIQAAYRGFQTRKKMKGESDLTDPGDLPDLSDQETLAAALKIQSAFKGYQVRKIHTKVPFTPQPSIDFDNMPPVGITHKSTSSKRFPPVPQRFDSQEMQRKTRSTSSNVPNDFGVKETPKSPLPARSSRLKEVAIPTVPPPLNENKSVHSKQELTSSASSNISELENKDDQAGFLQQSLLRKESLGSFFKKQSEPPSPITPTQPPVEEKERGRKESLTRAFREAGETIRSRSKSKEKQKKELSLPQKEKDEQTKSKIGGFFSSMFKSKSKQKPTTPTDPISPDMKAMSNVEFKFDETAEIKSQDHIKIVGEKTQKPSMKTDVRDDVIKSASPKASSSDADSRRSDKLSRASSKEEEIASCSSGSQLKLNKSSVTSKAEGKALRRMSHESKEISSKPGGPGVNGANISRQVVTPDKKITSVQSELDDPNLKKDLIHVVLTAVEENWLNQAPKPTLDKVAALQALDSDPELENSERSTSEADYVKKKMKAQKSEDLNSDDEGAQLCKQESADGDLPYVETTLPQERPGIVTITPSSQRLSQCKLTSTERPRSSSPRKPGKLSQYVKTKEKADNNKEPMTVKLPRQESKTKMKPKTGSSQQSWDKFSAAGLQSPKQVRKTAPQPKPERKKREPPKSVSITHDSASGKPDWIDCESLPEKKKQPKKYESTEPLKSPTDTGRAGLQTPTGTQIVSPEECSCDCHHESPPNTLTRTLSQKSRGVLRSSMAAASTSSSGSSSRPVPCAASRKKESPPTYKKAETCSKGAVPKSSRRPGGPPTPPIRTSSAVKSPKPSAGSREVLTRNPGEVASSSHSRTARTQGGEQSQQSEKVVRRVTQEGRAVRRRDEARRESLAKRSSTISSDD